MKHEELKLNPLEVLDQLTENWKENFSDKKSWFTKMEDYETHWNHRGSGVYSLGGQSVDILPANVYKLGIDPNGAIIYSALDVISDDFNKNAQF